MCCGVEQILAVLVFFVLIRGARRYLRAYRLERLSNEQNLNAVTTEFNLMRRGEDPEKVADARDQVPESQNLFGCTGCSDLLSVLLASHMINVLRRSASILLMQAVLTVRDDLVLSDLRACLCRRQMRAGGFTDDQIRYVSNHTGFFAIAQDLLLDGASPGPLEPIRNSPSGLCFWTRQARDGPAGHSITFITFITNISLLTIMIDIGSDTICTAELEQQTNSQTSNTPQMLTSVDHWGEQPTRSGAGSAELSTRSAS